jgi:hypothetical protein
MRVSPSPPRPRPSLIVYLDPHHKFENSMFGQVLKQLKGEKKYEWTRLRQSTIGRLDAGQKRAFRVKFEGTRPHSSTIFSNTSVHTLLSPFAAQE